MSEKILTVAGIDPSSQKLAIVETRESDKRKPFLHTFDLVGDDPYEERCNRAFEAIYGFCLAVEERDGVSPSLFLEAPVVGKGGPGVTIPQAYVEGAIMAAAAQAGAEIRLVNNSTWKKQICGNGNIAKVDIGPVVREIWPELYHKVPIVNGGYIAKELRGLPDQDLIDAGCINLFGWKRVELKERLSKRREKVA